MSLLPGWKCSLTRHPNNNIKKLLCRWAGVMCTGSPVVRVVPRKICHCSWYASCCSWHHCACGIRPSAGWHCLVCDLLFHCVIPIILQPWSSLPSSDICHFWRQVWYRCATWVQRTQGPSPQPVVLLLASFGWALLLSSEGCIHSHVNASKVAFKVKLCADSPCRINNLLQVRDHWPVLLALLPYPYK